MSDRFRHQLEDYRVVSFIEGKEVFLGGAGPASLSHVSNSPRSIERYQRNRRVVPAMLTPGSWWLMRNRLSLDCQVFAKHS